MSLGKTFESFPDGFDTEVLSFGPVKRRKRDAALQHQRNVPLEAIHTALRDGWTAPLATYLILATYQDMRGPWFRFVKEIRNAIAVPERTRRRHLRKLESLQLIELRQPRGSSYEVRVAPLNKWRNAPEK